TVVSAKIVWSTQCRLQVERYGLRHMRKGGLVANAEDQGSHAVGERQIVCRLGLEQMKVRLIPAAIEELRIVGFKQQTFGIAEPQPAKIQLDRRCTSDEIRLMDEARSVGLREYLVRARRAAKIARTDIYEQSAYGIAHRQFLVEEVAQCGEVRDGKL